MKLVFTAYEAWEPAHLVSTPSIRFDNTGKCTYASFLCDGHLPFDAETNPPKGLIRFMSDDDMILNEVTVEDFLRYEFNQNYEYVDDPEAEIDTVATADGGAEGEGEGATMVPQPVPQKAVESNYSLILTDAPVPEPIPEPEPPTEDELLAQAKQGRDQAINSAMEQAIYDGIDVETTYGMEHFTLNTNDQTLLLGIYGMVQQGITQYPYHSVGAKSRSNNICTVYSDEDIGKIAVAAFAHITFHESYANMLLQWLARETNRETVYTIQYGATLPSDLMEYLAMILTSAGIDPSVIPGYTPAEKDPAPTETEETIPSTEETGENDPAPTETTETTTTTETDTAPTEQEEPV